jgi:hypothetical protein
MRGKDRRLFIRVAHDFPDHPETVGLSDKAFRYVVEFWCYCHRHNTDGKIPATLWDRVPLKVQRELLVHYVDKIDNVLTNALQTDDKSVTTSYVMHDYTEHQQTAEEIDDLIEKRRIAGSLGGKAKAKRVASAIANGKQTPSKALLDIDIDIDIDKESGAEAPKQRSRAVPLPADFKVSDAMKSWAEGKASGIDLASETEKFQNWHLSKGSKFVSWEAAWRNWITKAVDYAKNSPSAGQKEWW